MRKLACRCMYGAAKWRFLAGSSLKGPRYPGAARCSGKSCGRRGWSPRRARCRCRHGTPRGLPPCVRMGEASGRPWHCVNARLQVEGQASNSRPSWHTGARKTPPARARRTRAWLPNSSSCRCRRDCLRRHSGRCSGSVRRCAARRPWGPSRRPRVRSSAHRHRRIRCRGPRRRRNCRAAIPGWRREWTGIASPRGANYAQAAGIGDVLVVDDPRPVAGLPTSAYRGSPRGGRLMWVGPVLLAGKPEQVLCVRHAFKWRTHGERAAPRQLL